MQETKIPQQYEWNTTPTRMNIPKKLTNDEAYYLAKKELVETYPNMPMERIESTLRNNGIFKPVSLASLGNIKPNAPSEKSGPKASKFKNVRTTVDGILFDSKAESKRYSQLKLLERCNAISNLELQKRYVLLPKDEYGGDTCYVADFVYFDNALNETVIEDVKGGNATKLPVYKLKKRMMASLLGLKIKEVDGDGCET